MNILLIYPYYPYTSVSTFEEPLGILYLASSLLNTSHKIDVMDLTFNRTMDGLAEKVQWADVVGISAPTPLFGTADIVLQAVKAIKPDIVSIVGGPHATAAPHDALKTGFDVAVIGEGEETIRELADALEAGTPLDNVAGIAYPEDEVVHFTAQRPFIPNLDNIAFPARQFIDYSRYRRVGLIAMRGCPYRCIYCKPVEDKLFGKKLRKRSLENVVEEIDALLSTYRTRQLSFKDDTLTIYKREWFERLGEALQRRNPDVRWQCSSRVDTIDFEKLVAMKNAGCQQIFFGIESGSQRILDYYRKDIHIDDIVRAFDMCRRAGIRPAASIMLGAPMETREDLESTYRLVKAIKPFNWHVHITTPICGSYLYDQAKAEHRLRVSSEDYSAFEPTGNIYRLNLPMKLDRLSAEDIAEYRDRINVYMKFRVMLNCLLTPRIWKELLFSRGTRTIAFNFVRRHFRLFGRKNSKDPKHSKEGYAS